MLCYKTFQVLILLFLLTKKKTEITKTFNHHRGNRKTQNVGNLNHKYRNNNNNTNKQQLNKFPRIVHV